ncbi:MAG: prepilin peptidase [Pseudonocardiales bacterium]|nr:prepilin peptidase [Pseudonocardiales bacterium]
MIAPDVGLSGAGAALAAAGTAWPVLLFGVPAAVVLWTSTSRAPTDRAADRLAVAAAAFACLVTVAARPSAQAMVALPLAVAGVAAACVDAREGRLPDALTVALPPVTVTAVGLAAHGRPGSAVDVPAALVEALISAALGLLAAMAVKLVSDAVLGWGDVKLAPTLAIVVGHGGSPAVFAVLAAVGVALTALAVRTGVDAGDSAIGTGRGGDRGTVALVPYGPALVVGALGAAAGAPG